MILDAYFYVGVTNTVIKQLPPYGDIPDENGNGWACAQAATN